MWREEITLARDVTIHELTFKELIMGSFSIWHWLIVLVVVALIFGTSKLRNIGKDLSGAVKGFKEGMQTSDDHKSASTAIEGEVQEKIKS